MSPRHTEPGEITMPTDVDMVPIVAGDGFDALCRVHPLRPIKSDAEHDRAIARINDLLDRPELTPGEADYLAVLGMIVERHESLLYGEPPAGPEGETGE